MGNCLGKKPENTSAPEGGGAAANKAGGEKPRRLSQAEMQQQELMNMYQAGRAAGTIVDARAASAARSGA